MHLEYQTTAGGLAFIIKENIRVNSVQFVDNRIGIIRLSGLTIVNVYLPYYDGTSTQKIEFESEICTLESILKSEKMNKQEVIIAGDFNTDLVRLDNNSLELRRFLSKNKLIACDILNKKRNDICHTFSVIRDGKMINSWIDHVLTSSESIVMDSLEILLSSSNKSDHNAIEFAIKYEVINNKDKYRSNTKKQP